MNNGVTFLKYLFGRLSTFPFHYNTAIGNKLKKNKIKITEMHQQEKKMKGPAHSLDNA